MPTEDWIQESLARLESLEEERNRHEAALETATDPATLRMNAQAIERLDAKIRSLYAELEAAAEQGDGSDEEQDDGHDEHDEHDEEPSETGEGATRLFRRDDVAAQAAAVHAVAAAPAPTPAPRPAPVATMPQQAPTPVAAPISPAPASPMASPFGGAVAPFSTGPASPFGEVAAPFPSSEQASFSTSGSSYGSDDEPSGGGSKMGLIIAGVVLVLGIGGYFAFKGKTEEPPPAAPTGPATVIRAGEIPPDTQGPKTVKGSDVDAIKGTQFKEGRPVPSGNSGGSGSNPTPTEKPKKKDPRAKIQQADDPLAGIDK